MNTVPSLPESAPFTLAQRLWLNGYLAAMFPEEGGGAPLAAAKPKPRVLLMYGSQSGNAEGLAEEYAEQLVAAGYEAPVYCLDEFEEVDLSKEKALLIMTSTWGDGDPPDNAIDFWKAISDDSYPRIEGLSYSVLALGDSNYIDFCGAGKAFDERLAALGATPLVPRVDCDVDFEEPAAGWFEQVAVTLKDVLGGAESDESAPATETKAAPKFSKKNPFVAMLKANEKLNTDGSPKDNRHFEIDLAESGLAYEVGDVLGVIPENCPDLVADLISALGFAADAETPLPDGGVAPLSEALGKHYDLRTVNKALLETWLGLSSSEQLEALLADEDVTVVQNYLWGREVIDLLIEHPCSFESPADFVSHLRKINPRLYSISSSPKAHPGEVHLTVAKVEYESQGRIRKGVCSSFLADRCNGGGVRVYVQGAKHFKPPTDPTRPMIMVGPGTGIAPFRAFLEEREVLGEPGPNWLFFGNPHSETDYFYKSQLEGMKEKGVLTKLDLAWSRDQAEKVYVQDKMRENGAELWKWLDDGGHFYVCGDAKRMAKDVDHALHEVISEHGGYSPEAAADYVAAMKKEKRYQRDVY